MAAGRRELTTPNTGGCAAFVCSLRLTRTNEIDPFNQRHGNCLHNIDCFEVVSGDQTLLDVCLLPDLLSKLREACTPLEILSTRITCGLLAGVRRNHRAAYRSSLDIT